MFVICHVRLLVGIQFRFATVHSSVTQPEPVSIGSVLPRAPLGIRTNQDRKRKRCPKTRSDAFTLLARVRALLETLAVSIVS